MKGTVRGLLAIMLLGLAVFPALSGWAAATQPLQSYEELVATLLRHDAGGQVVDKDGNPVAGADVFLLYQRGENGFRDRLAGRTKTDADGNFHFSKAVVWEPVAQHESSQRAPAYAAIARDENLGIAFTTFLENDPADQLKIKMTKKDMVEVSISDSAGKPLEGVKVFLADGSKPGRAEGDKYEYFNFRLMKDIGLSSGLTGKDGKVKLLAMPDAQYWAEKDGYVRGWQRKMILFPSAQVSGRVTDADGKPLAGVPVWFYYSGQSLGYDDFTVTDKDGRYILKDVPGNGFRYSWMKPESEKDATGKVSIYAQDTRVSSTLISKAANFALKPGDKLTKDLTLEKGLVFAGQVVDARTGKPIPNMDFYRSAGDGSNSLKMMKADSQGRFRALYPKGAETSLYMERSRSGDYILEEEQSGRQVYKTTLTADKTDVVIKAKLWRVGTLHGTVIDFDNKPTPYPHSIYIHSDVPPVKTGPDGTFTLKVAPLDRDFDLFVIGPRKLGGALGHFKAGTTSATLRTQRFRDYPGVVKTPDGNPAAKLKFYLDLKLNGSTVYQVRQEPQTNADGLFAAKGLLPTATYYAWWSADNEQNRDYDYGNATIDLSKLKANESIKFEAKQYVNALMGKVVDEQGKPVAGAQLSIANSEMQPQDVRFNKKYESDKKGNFTIDRLAAGKVSLKVAHPQYKTRTVELASDEVDATIKLSPRGGEIITKIQVLDEVGKPRAGTPLTVMTGMMKMPDFGKLTTSTQTLQTDSQGRAEYRMKTPKPDELQMFTGGQIFCDLPGYDLACGAIQRDEDADVTLRLVRSNEHWTGQVVDENQKPIAGARVAISGLRPDKNGAFVGTMESGPFVTTTGRDGRFEFPRIGRQCGLSLTVTAPGRERINNWIDENNNPAALFALAPAGSITGRVTIKGSNAPVTTGTIFAQMQNGGVGQSKIDSQGAFTLDSLKPGEYMVAYQLESIGSSRYVMPAPAKVTVETGKRAALNIALEEGIEVSGKLIDPATGKPPAGRVFFGAQMKDQQFMGGGSEVKPDGSWTLYLAPGTYQLMYVTFTSGQPQEKEVPKPLTVEKGKTYRDIVIEAK